MSCEARRTLPVLGEKVSNPSTSALEDYRVPEFSLTNQLGRPASSATLGPRVQVVDFFFTYCSSICPQMTSHLKLVQEAFAEQDKVRILSFSIDSENDTPARLREYGEGFGIDPTRWWLLTGDEDAILALSKDYKVRAFNETLGEQRNLIHDGTFVLVDEQRRIRGYYSGLDRDDVRRLIADIRTLL